MSTPPETLSVYAAAPGCKDKITGVITSWFSWFIPNTSLGFTVVNGLPNVVLMKLAEYHGLKR